MRTRPRLPLPLLVGFIGVAVSLILWLVTDKVARLAACQVIVLRVQQHVPPAEGIKTPDSEAVAS
jgi:hypothetical protein